MQKATLLVLSLPLKWQVTDPAFTWALHINKAAPETNMPSPSTRLASFQGFIEWLFFLPFEIVPTWLLLRKISRETWGLAFILSAVNCCENETGRQSNMRNSCLQLDITHKLYLVMFAAWSRIADIDWAVLIYRAFCFFLLLFSHHMSFIL